LLLYNIKFAIQEFELEIGEKQRLAHMLTRYKATSHCTKLSWSLLCLYTRGAFDNNTTRWKKYLSNFPEVLWAVQSERQCYVWTHD